MSLPLHIEVKSIHRKDSVRASCPFHADSEYTTISCDRPESRWFRITLNRDVVFCVMQNEASVLFLCKKISPYQNPFAKKFSTIALFPRK